MAGQSHRAAFVGRQRELTVLSGYLAAATHGDGGVVLVAGEPGIGKTRLLAELATHARAGGWTVLHGRAYDTDGMPPYLPVIEALRAHLRAASPERLAAQFGRAAADVARLVPELAEVLPGLAARPPLGPEQERYRLFEGVCDALAGIARGSETGLLLTLDDLHWADAPTLALLVHLARRLAGTPLLVTVAYRTADAEPSDDFTAALAALAREGGPAPLLLTPLDGDETAALAASIAGGAVAEAVAGAIRRTTEGNPFFIGELVRHFQAEGRDLAESTTAGVAWTVPELVRQVVTARLSRLRPDTREFLQVAAVLGDGFTFEVGCQASGPAEHTTLEAVEEALISGALRVEGATYHFTHALIRRTLYDALSPPRRARLHLRAAEALEVVHGREVERHLSALAEHYRLAGAAADPDLAISYAVRAGEAALAVFAWEDATAHLQSALALLPGQADHGDRAAIDARRADLLLALGDAQMKSGDRPGGRATLQQAAALARRMPSPERLARAALTLGGVQVEPGVTDDLLVELLREARDALPDGEGVLRARVLARLAMERRFEELWAGSSRLGREAVAAARQVGDVPALGLALDALCLALLGAGYPDEHEHGAVAGELLQLARATGDATLTMQSHIHLVYYHTRRGDMAAFDAELAAAARLADELRQSYYHWWVAAYSAMRALLAGDLPAAERRIEQAYGLGQRLESRPIEHNFAAQLLALRREQGRLAECEADLLGSNAVNEPDNFGGSNQWQFTVALFVAERGRIDEARRRFEAGAGRGVPIVEGQGGWLSTLTCRAELCVALNDVAHAAELYDILLPHAHRVPWTFPVLCVGQGSVARYLAMLATTLGRWDAAERHFDQAIAVHTRMGARPLLAHTLRQYAAMLLQRRGPTDRTRAHGFIEQAVRLYREMGMASWVATAEALLTDAAPAGATAPSYPDGLSEREVDVLRLLASGASNPRIAETLVISLNTVTRHITHILTKIGAANRTEAAAYAHRHGLV